MLSPLRYQSPIPLCYNEELFPISQCIRVKGKNKGAIYNEENNIFELQDKIIMKINNKPYVLIEYHFHVPSEHIINNKKYPAEIHYVFEEINKNNNPKNNPNNNPKNRKKYGCVCDGNYDGDTNILVIGRVIKNNKHKKHKNHKKHKKKKHKNLSKLQPNIPSTYFEYDGSLTGTGDETVPVRWIVGNKYIRLPLNEIDLIAKSARSLQPLDDRIILFKC